MKRLQVIFSKGVVKSTAIRASDSVEYIAKWCFYVLYGYADMAELVDALASGASGLTAVEVRVLLSAPKLPTAA